MWLNQRTVDAIRIMAELASVWPERRRALDLPESTGITVMNIQKTVHALALGHLIETHRGRSGGMRLAREPARITIGEIVRVFEPTDCPVSFLMGDSVDEAIARTLFRAHRGFFGPLESTTIADLVAAPHPPPESGRDGQQAVTPL